jgi:hypothetical protein
MLLVKVVSQYWFVTLIAIQKNFTIIAVGFYVCLRDQRNIGVNREAS